MCFSVLLAFWSPCLGKRQLVFVLIVHLFVSYAHVNLCHFFSSSWCLGLAAASACGSSWTFLFTFFQWRLEENRTDKDIQRGSYKSAHVLLNLSNELGKKIGCESLPNILSIFPAELNKFNNTGAWIQGTIYHMTLKSHFLSDFRIKTPRFRH